jgi:salicylate---CoA ligase
MSSAVVEGVVPWPDSEVRRFLAEGYWEGRTLGDHLWQQADSCPDEVAVVDEEVRLTYRELVERADVAATRLHDLGLRSGERVVVQLPNTWQFVVLTLACLRLGVVPVMALTGHREHELTHLADLAGAVAVVVPGQLRAFDHEALGHTVAGSVDSVRHVLVASDLRDSRSVALRPLLEGGGDAPASRRRWDADQPAADAPAVFLLSGGTTGLPKLIVRTHNDYTYNAKRSAEVSALGPDAVYLVALPAAHNFPLACPGLLGALLVGGRVVMLASPEPARAFATIAAERVTHTAVVPAVAQRWLEHRDADPDTDLSSLRVLQVGGARLAEEVARRVQPMLGCVLQQVFGMAEGLLNYTRLDDPVDVVVGTQGRPMSAADEVLLVDEHDQPVAAGELGSLLTRGPYTPRGYFRAPEHNAKAFTPDGWYRSGDVCRWHPSGNLVVEGRDKDMINRGGEKISAEEVENLVYQRPDVLQVAAVAMPDPVLGERVCLYVVPREASDLTLEGVRDTMQRKGVATFKLPDRLVLVEELPVTKVGKIDKKWLRNDIASRLEAAGPG